jgi:pyrroloquinoline quinone biosynthesis protein B
VLIRVLGSAAGGGLPQWNCGCANCEGVRAGTIDAEPRTQESVAVSADGRSWVLLNASPDIGHQLARAPFLAPRAKRDSPIAAIVLTSGDIDHCLGLFSLRESQPFVVYATARVWRELVERNVTTRTLARFRGQVRWETLALDAERDLQGPDGVPVGLRLRAVPAPGKLPLHLEGLMDPQPEDNVGLVLRARETHKTLAYFPGVARISEGVRAAAQDADCLFFDGTFWSSDELIAAGVGTHRAEEMAHLPVGGEGGSLAQLAELALGRRIYIHVNNTNPILRASSRERAAVARGGWEVAADAMEIAL